MEFILWSGRQARNKQKFKTFLILKLRYNHIMKQSQSTKILLSLTILMFVFISTFGILHMGMNMGPNGKMSDCPFAPGGSSICTMTPLEHIGAVQSMFTTLPAEKVMMSLFALLLSAALIFSYFSRSISPPKLLSYQYIRHRDYIPLHSFLQEAFSRGILNPKIF